MADFSFELVCWWDSWKKKKTNQRKNLINNHLTTKNTRVT